MENMIPTWFDITLNPEGYRGTNGKIKYNVLALCGHIFTNRADRVKLNIEKCPTCKSIPTWYDASINDGWFGYNKMYNIRSKCGCKNNYIIHSISDTVNLIYMCNACRKFKSLQPPVWFDESINPSGYNKNISIYQNIRI